MKRVAGETSPAAAISSERATLVYIRLFGRPMWLLCPLFIAWATIRQDRLRAQGMIRSFPLAAVSSVLTICLGLTTPFRSRPFFAVGIVVGVAFDK